MVPRSFQAGVPAAQEKAISMSESRAEIVHKLFYRDRIDTARIADWLDIPESKVWNILAHGDGWKAKNRSIMARLKRVQAAWPTVAPVRR